MLMQGRSQCIGIVEATVAKAKEGERDIARLNLEHCAVIIPSPVIADFLVVCICLCHPPFLFTIFCCKVLSSCIDIMFFIVHLFLF